MPRAPICCAGSIAAARPPPPTAPRSRGSAARPSAASSRAGSPRSSAALIRELAVLVDVADRGARVARLIEQRGEVVVRLGEPRIVLEGAAVEPDRLLLVVAVLRDHAEVVVGGGVAG